MDPRRLELLLELSRLGSMRGRRRRALGDHLDGLPADRGARPRGGHPARRARGPPGPAHPGRPAAGRPRRDDPRRDRGGPAGPRPVGGPGRHRPGRGVRHRRTGLADAGRAHPGRRAPRRAPADPRARAGRVPGAARRRRHRPGADLRVRPRAGRLRRDARDGAAVGGRLGARGAGRRPAGAGHLGRRPGPLPRQRLDRELAQQLRPRGGRAGSPRRPASCPGWCTGPTASSWSRT